jgi:ribosomal protein S12 methylthiotransferase accessory factor
MLLRAAERQFVRIHLFDATTDLGVPTVYALHVAEHDTQATNLVACATARSMVSAAEKACTEGLHLRGHLHSDEPIPDDPAHFHNVVDGARYMGDARRAAAFNFLTADDAHRPAASTAAMTLSESSDEALVQLLDVFRTREMSVVAVDRTPPDLAEAGLTCVSIMIPDLQPMSLHPYAQFKGHRRLYDAPARMGWQARTEEELNQWPQPFA